MIKEVTRSYSTEGWLTETYKVDVEDYIGWCGDQDPLDEGLLHDYLWNLDPYDSDIEILDSTFEEAEGIEEVFEEVKNILNKQNEG